ncbi:MAG: hypothetical protein G01um1014106_244 [Parcubacteria group bacterium Gr01-1014_106]|nr:MAG: hypothetical protein G01um1014106_244 [Parcubacteria group bacterium Gr01-1014_106]
MQGQPSQFVHISTWTIVRVFLVAALIGLAYVIRDILAALLFAIIIASALEPGIAWLKRHRVPRIVSVVALYLAIACVALFFIYLVFPLLLEDAISLVRTFPLLQEQFVAVVEHLNIASLSPFLTDKIPEFLVSPGAYLQRFGGGVVGFITSVFGGIFTFFLIVVFSFHLAIQERGIENFIRLIVPVRQERYIVNLWERAQRQLGRWFRAQLLLGAIVGILTFFGLTFLGIPNALFFAMLAAAFEIIPVAGPILASIPPIAAAFFLSPFLGVFTVGLYILVQQLESNVIVPVVMQRSVGLNPLVVVLALLIGVNIGGLFGALLAVPVVAVAAELIDDWDKRKRLAPDET